MAATSVIQDMATLLAALARARPPRRLVLRGGTYFLPRVLRLTDRHSGITFAAAPGERVILSGGRRVTGWTVGSRCWTAQVPGSFKQLFVNGQRRPRTRWPATGFFYWADPTSRAPSAGWFKSVREAYVPEGALDAGWRNLSDVDIVSPNGFWDDHLRIKSFDPVTRRVEFTSYAVNVLTGEHGKMARFYVENVFEKLDSPGQWYHDRPTGTLYYRPMPGEEPDETEVIAGRLDAIVRLAGCREVTFENIAFHHAENFLPPDYPGDPQAAYTVPGAIQLDRAENCRLIGCEIAHVAGYGIEVMQGSYRNEIRGCAMFDLGGGGVKINHEVPTGGPAPRNVSLRKVRGPVRGMRTTISDCTIHDGGLIYHGACGIAVLNAGRNRIRHNHIFRFNYSGISCGWDWGPGETVAIDNRIEYNHVHDIGQGMLSDLGGIYCLGVQPGLRIRHNHIHDVTVYSHSGFGIYYDGFTAESRVEHNLIYRTASCAFFQNSGHDNVVQHNILLNTVHAFRSFRLRKNIICVPRRQPHEILTPRQAEFYRENIYWNPTGPVRVSDLSYPEWQRAFQADPGSLVADPLFRDPAGDDYTLRPDSPAHALGFQPIDLRHVGPRRPFPVREADKPAEIVRLKFSPGKEAVHLDIINAGEVRARGRVRVRVKPGYDVALTPNKPVTYDLRPGQTKRVTFACRLGPGEDRVGLVAEATGRGALDTDGEFVFDRQWSDGWRRVRSGAFELGEVQARAAADVLTLRARVRDACVTPSVEQPWTHSCIEVFAIPVGSTALPVQLFLLPPTATEPARGLKMYESQRWPVEPSIVVTGKLVEGGYELEAQIPFAILGIPAGAKEFRLDAGIATHVTKARGSFVQAALFSPTSPAWRTDFFGTITTNER
ncbi:MAG: right-handed parallel beta-helix repeat-containing protein [Verrucomicrobiae bacterium]|nr:right-handed parallel beta-helix repeat-containing protein [Verrucomicrobiae bacterium]